MLNKNPPPFPLFPFPFQDSLNLHSKTCQDSQAPACCVLSSSWQIYATTVYSSACFLATFLTYLCLHLMVPASCATRKVERKASILFLFSGWGFFFFLILLFGRWLFFSPLFNLFPLWFSVRVWECAHNSLTQHFWCSVVLQK